MSARRPAQVKRTTTCVMVEPPVPNALLHAPAASAAATRLAAVISIVTPCLNQGTFVGTALESVAIQDVEVEHIVRDGGSTDGSVDVIRAHDGRLNWTSEPDGGQYDALQK